jgi:anti-anti-sigma factor
MEHSPTTPCVVEVSQDGSSGITVLKVNGPLTIHNFFEFQDLTRQQTAPMLLIDLSDVPYMDSAALGSLVGIHVSRDAAKKKYAVVGCNDRLQNLLTVTHIAQFLVTYPTVAEAKAALS